MANVTRSLALQAFKKADWFGLSWGHLDPQGGPTHWCAAAWVMIWAHGPEVFEPRGDLMFPKSGHLAESLDCLAQIANWAEVLGFIHRTSFQETVTDTYIFRQEKVSRLAREG